MSSKNPMQSGKAGAGSGQLSVQPPGSPLQRSASFMGLQSPSSPNGRRGSPLSGGGSVSLIDTSKVKKNSRGGVMVTPEELRTAFSFLDADKTGMISMTGLKKRLGVFFPEMSAKDYRFLMNNKKELTFEV